MRKKLYKIGLHFLSFLVNGSTRPRIWSQRAWIMDWHMMVLEIVIGKKIVKFFMVDTNDKRNHNKLTKYMLLKVVKKKIKDFED